jgi:polyhydroxyalkanoate synthase subunit PhaC
MAATMPGTGGGGPRPVGAGNEEIGQQWLRQAETLRATLQAAKAPVGLSPKEVVWRKNKARLYRYTASAPRTHRVPILIVYALINRPYILDLAPGNSLIEFLVGQGFDVFLLDWGIPGPEDRTLRLDDYVFDYIPKAARKVRTISGVDEFTVLGYCIGGTLSTLYAATHPDDPLRNLVLLTTPIEFSEVGLLHGWTNAGGFDVDKLIDTYGNMPGELIDLGTKLLRPMGNVSNYTKLWEKALDDRYVRGWQAMSRWVNDAIPFPGEAFRQWIKDFYQGNKLIKGTLTMGGGRVDLAKIRASLLVVAAEKDHIAPLPSCSPLLEKVASADKEFIALPGGHVSIVVGRNAVKGLWPRLAAWLSERSDE